LHVITINIHENDANDDDSDDGELTVRLLGGGWLLLEARRGWVRL